VWNDVKVVRWSFISVLDRFASSGFTSFCSLGFAGKTLFFLEAVFERRAPSSGWSVMSKKRWPFWCGGCQYDQGR
jgi:hypothetical protein